MTDFIKNSDNLAQHEINSICCEIWHNACEELLSTYDSSSNDYLPYLNENNWKRLRSCQAYVLETENYYFLKSYNTIVAVIEKSTDTLIDMLRREYGFTRTSAQHISKFCHDYCAGKWTCHHIYTWRQTK